MGLLLLHTFTYIFFYLHWISALSFMLFLVIHFLKLFSKGKGVTDIFKVIMYNCIGRTIQSSTDMFSRYRVHKNVCLDVVPGP